MFPSEFRTAVVAAVGATLMAAVVACAPGASTASPSQPGGDHDAFIQCMTDNGVPAPSEGGPVVLVPVVMAVRGAPVARRPTTGWCSPA